MTNLLGSDGKVYSAETEEQKAQALASGQFTDLTQQSNIPAPPDQSKEMMQKLQDEPILHLKNVATNQEEEIPETEANAKIRAGTHTVSDVPLIGADGKTYEAPNEAAITQALQSGQFRLSTLAERQHAQSQHDIQTKIKEENSDAGMFSPEYVTGRKEHSLWNQVTRPFAPPEVQEAYQTVAEEAKKKDPTAYYEGATTGETLGAGMAAGAGKLVTGALGLSEAAPFLSKAGLGKAAIESTFYQAPAVAETIANKDPVATAEIIGSGIAGIGILHGLAAGAGKLAGMVEESVAPKIAEREIAEAAGIGTKDTIETALPKIEKYRQESPVIQSAFKALDESAESKVFAQDAMHKANGEIEKLLPEKIATRDAAEAEVSRLEKVLKEAKTPAAYQDYKAAKDALSILPKLSKSEKVTQTLFDAMLSKTQAAAADGTFAAAKDAESFLAKQAEEHTIAKEAHDVFVKNTLKAQADAALKSGDPKVVAGLRELTALENVTNTLKNAGKKTAESAADHGILAWPSITSIGHVLSGLPSGPVHVAASVLRPMIRRTLHNGLKAIGRSSVAKSVLESVAPVSDYATHLLQDQELRLAKNAKSFFSEFQSNSSAKAFVVSGGLKTFLPDNGSGKSHAQQVKALRTLVNENKNPETFAANAEPVISALKAEGLHKVADEYTQHQLRLMKVLDTFLPKDPTLQKANPFAPKMLSADDVSPMAKAKYERALSIAADPTTLLQLVKTNQITAGDVAIAAATNPSTLAKLQNAVLQEAIKHKPDLSYQQRLSMGIFMAKNLDDSTEETPTLQSVYEAPPPSGTSGKPAGGSKVSAKTATDLKDSNKTVSQLAAGH